MNEIPLVFGSDRHLVGTLTLPAPGAPAKPIAFVLLNAGVLHRVGPHRINVKLARHLARMGFTCLRFDLSGQGDSRSPAGGLDFAQQNVADVRMAMDHLARTVNLHRFAVAGICSGADNGLATAQADPRVAALCLIDGYHYATPKTSQVQLQRRLQRGGLLQAVARRLRSAFTAPRASGGAEEIPNGRPFPEQAAHAQVMQSLVDREVQMLLLFSGSLTQYNHPEQFNDSFAGHGFVDKVVAQYCPDIDHTATPLGAQRDLLQRIGNWADGLK